MAIALLFALVGTLLCFYLGTRFCDLEISKIAAVIVATNIAGLIAAIAVLNLQLVKFFKRYIIFNVLSTWIFFLSIYLVLTVAFSPSGISFKQWVIMILPLVGSTGFAIVIFGPIQDRIVRYRHERKKLKH